MHLLSLVYKFFTNKHKKQIIVNQKKNDLFVGDASIYISSKLSLSNKSTKQYKLWDPTKLWKIIWAGCIILFLVVYQVPTREDHNHNQEKAPKMVSTLYSTSEISNSLSYQSCERSHLQEETHKKDEKIQSMHLTVMKQT